MTVRCRDEGLTRALSGDLSGLVFVADPEIADHWEDVRAELHEAYLLSKIAAIALEAIVYVVRGDDLLGREGIGAAIVATGLLSAARTASLELKDVSVNTLAVEADSPSEEIARWVRHLLNESGPRGELMRLGTGHLGKTLP